VILLTLTIFGASLVSKASTVMSVCILICCAIIFTVGVKARLPEISTVFSTLQAPKGLGTPC
jgi:purine-cytosine permease-like protein